MRATGLVIAMGAMVVAAAASADEGTAVATCMLEVSVGQVDGAHEVRTASTVTAARGGEVVLVLDESLQRVVELRAGDVPAADSTKCRVTAEVRDVEHEPMTVEVGDGERVTMEVGANGQHATVSIDAADAGGGWAD